MVAASGLARSSASVNARVSPPALISSTGLPAQANLGKNTAKSPKIKALAAIAPHPRRSIRAPLAAKVAAP